MESLVSLPSTATNSVVFPPPPPTSNTLTLGQRAQLRKSTKKLGQILGATPHLLDTDIVSILGPVHIELPPRNEAPSPVLSDSPTDSYYSRSSSSCSYYSHPYAASASFEGRPSTPSPSRKGSLHFKSSSSSRLADDTQAPVLRLAVTPPSPTSSSSSPAPSPSPSRASAKFRLINPHTRSNSLDDTPSTTNSPNDMRFTLRPARHSTSGQPGDCISEPSFHIPSPSNVRLQKMDRLRKMLGEDVPAHLVFPDQKLTKNSEAISENDHPIGLSPVAVAGTVIPRPKKANVGKIVGSRDSMGALSPHRAKRQEKEKAAKPQSPPPPSPPIVIPASCIPKDPSQKPLCVIVESPEEHGSSALEGFGFGGCTRKKPSVMMVQSSWHIQHGGSIGSGSEADDASKLWSTRRGYAGWDRSMAFAKPEQERKKKPMSYRKPPPSIDF